MGGACSVQMAADSSSCKTIKAALPQRCYPKSLKKQGRLGCETSLEEKYQLGGSVATKVFSVKRKGTIGRVRNTEQFVVYRLLQNTVHGTPDVLQNVASKISHLAHGGACTLVDVFDDKRYVHLVYTKVSGKPIFEQISKQKYFSEANAASIAQQLAHTLSYAEKAGLNHGALEPKNIFVTEDCQVEVTDLGLAGTFKAGPLTTGPGNVMAFMAPEIVKRWEKKAKKMYQAKDPKWADHVALTLEEGQSLISHKSDVYSLGAIMFMVLFGKAPFLGEPAELAASISEDEVHFDDNMCHAVSEDAIDFLRQTLHKNPANRASAQDLLHHPWLVNGTTAFSANKNLQVCKQLGKFHADSSLKKAMMRMIATQVPPNKIKELQAAFATMDVDGDGSVDWWEFQQGLAKYPELSKDLSKDMKTLFKEMDHDGDGRIDLREFASATIDSQTALMDQFLWDTFQSIDTDRSGTVSRSELMAAVVVSNGVAVDMVKKLLEGGLQKAFTFDAFRELILDGNVKKAQKKCMNSTAKLKRRSTMTCDEDDTKVVKPQSSKGESSQTPKLNRKSSTTCDDNYNQIVNSVHEDRSTDSETSKSGNSERSTTTATSVEAPKQKSAPCPLPQPLTLSFSDDESPRSIPKQDIPLDSPNDGQSEPVAASGGAPAARDCLACGGTGCGLCKGAAGTVSPDMGSTASEEKGETPRGRRRSRISPDAKDRKSCSPQSDASTAVPSQRSLPPVASGKAEDEDAKTRGRRSRLQVRTSKASADSGGTQQEAMAFTKSMSEGGRRRASKSPATDSNRGRRRSEPSTGGVQDMGVRKSASNGDRTSASPSKSSVEGAGRARRKSDPSAGVITSLLAGKPVAKPTSEGKRLCASPSAPTEQARSQDGALEIKLPRRDGKLCFAK